MAWMKPHEAILKLPEVLFRSRMSFAFDGIPIVAEDLTLKKKLNLIKLGISSMFFRNFSLGLPAVVQVEPTNRCNLQCPLCPAGEGSMQRGKGVMSLETYHQILDELGDVMLVVLLYSWGEPFLNRDLNSIIRASVAKNINSLVLTNGHFVQTIDEALELVDTGLNGLLIAMDGSTQETYTAYRKGGKLEKVMRCAELVEEAKAKRGSATPYTCLRTLVTKDTQEELPDIERLARDLGVNMFSYKTVGMQTYCDEFRDFEPTIDKLKRFEYSDSERKAQGPINCPFPFRQPTIQWDGTLVGCEYDYDVEKPFGKVGERPIRELWNGPQARTLRQHILGGEQDTFCQRLCPYQDRVQSSSYLGNIELRPGR
ncbi:MAG: radical SAM protein [Halieaceae bacterium]|jgi:MoaA/NifB/PqqE/SkfB family radical SAM enzyme|nr:radical SAM protein [Halieaceae bacterium]